MNAMNWIGLGVLIGIGIGVLVMYQAGTLRMAAMKQRFADDRREAGMRAYSNGLAFGMTIGRGEIATHVRDGKLEHWDADAETCLRSLILPSTFSTYPEE